MNRLRRSTAPTGRNAKQNRGAAAVEFALIMPIFLLLLMGIIEFAMIGFHKLALTQAARVGSRDLSLGETTAKAISDTESAAPGITIAAANIKTEYCSASCSNDGSWMPLGDNNNASANSAPADALVRIRIENWPHTLITGSFFCCILSNVKGNTLLLNSQMAMRRE